MQLISTTFTGNLHQASDYVNRMGLAQYVLMMHPTGSHVVVVFRVPSDRAAMIRRLLDYAPEAWDNPPRYKLFTGIGDE